MSKNVCNCLRKCIMRNKPKDSKRLPTLRTVSPKKSTPGKRLYTVPELLGLTGMTRKQASYWAQIKLLSPRMRTPKARAGSPSSFYSAEEVVKAMIICDLKRAGFSLRQVQQVTRNLEEHGIRLDTAENYLLTDGYSVYYADSDNEAVDI